MIVVVVTVAAVAYAMGMFSGLILKPSRQVFCQKHGTTLGCIICQEVTHAAPRPTR